MYNEEQKKRFVAREPLRVNRMKIAEATFNAISKYEEEWQADLCTKSAEELQPVLDKVMPLRAGSQATQIEILRDYVKWCIDTGVPDACDGMLNVTIVGLGKIRTKMVSGPAQLQRHLDAVFDEEERGTIDNIYRCYCWMVFGGIDEKDTALIKVSDVSFREMYIRYKATSVPIYREALPAFYNAVEMKEFLYEHPNYKPVWRERVPGDTLLRGIRSETSLNTLRTALYQKTNRAIEQGKTEQCLKFGAIWLSGLFYRMYEQERSGFPADFSEAAAERMEAETYHIRSKNRAAALKKIQDRRAMAYMEDYQRWKLAFSV